MRMPEPTHESRRFPRAKVSFDTDVSVERGGVATHAAGRFVVLSGGGAFLEIGHRYPVGSLLTVRFTLPANEDTITCRAIVRNEIEGSGVGIEFIDIAPLDRERVQAFVRQALQ